MRYRQLLSILLLTVLIAAAMAGEASAASGSYTLHYLPNGAAGSMADTVAVCGTQVTLAECSYTLEGSLFRGWTARRESDGSWLYIESTTGRSGWYVWGSQPSGWTTRVITDGMSTSSLTTVDGDVIGLYAKWDDTYTIAYTPTDGSGTMEDTLAPISGEAVLRQNTFVREGHAFKGWTARRDSDGTWLYESGDGTASGWYVWGSQPSGWTTRILSDGASVSGLSAAAADRVVLYAKWTQSVYTVQYIPAGGSGTMEDDLAPIGHPFRLTPNAYTYQGKLFGGWTARRSSDGTWLYESGDGTASGWYVWGSQPSGWSTPRLEDGQQVLDLSVTAGDTVELYAKWVSPDSFTAMSFNVRNTNAAQDPASRDAQGGTYPDYTAMVRQRILEHLPDTVGLQEVDAAWYSYFTGSDLMDTYAIVGHGRNEDTTGEATPILYNKTKFTLVDSGTRWLTADGTYGVNADGDYPRICTYALLQRKSDGVRMLVVNTHLGLSQLERLEQAQNLKSFLDSFPHYPKLITGDFNTEMSETGTYDALCQLGLRNAAFEAADGSEPGTPTFTRYGAYSKVLDYLFLDRDRLEVESYRVCSEQIDGFDVSDHFPILVEYALEDGIADPDLQLSYPSLSFEDEIFYNVYFTVGDMTSVEELGLMLLSSRQDDATIDDAIGTIPGYQTNGTMYMVRSEGIAAAYMADTLYFKIYAKLTDGSYAYSTAGGYNAKAYANTVLSGDYTDEMKSLAVSMVNYGAEAQLYFEHNTDALVNAALTDDQKALVDAYDETMVDAVVTADSSKTANFVRVSSNFKSLYPSVSFDSAFSINFYCTPAITVDSGMTLYYWDAETYNSITEFTVDNATGSMEMTESSGQYWGNVPGIAAKDMDKTYYVSCVFESEGETVTTGIIAYSLGKYCEGKAATDGDTQQTFAQATAVYGYYAKQYFASIA